MPTLDWQRIVPPQTLVESGLGDELSRRVGAVPGDRVSRHGGRCRDRRAAWLPRGTECRLRPRGALHDAPRAALRPLRQDRLRACARQWRRALRHHPLRPAAPGVSIFASQALYFFVSNTRSATIDRNRRPGGIALYLSEMTRCRASCAMRSWGIRAAEGLPPTTRRFQRGVLRSFACALVSYQPLALLGSMSLVSA